MSGFSALIGKKSGPPPKSGPTPQGLNINYNTVKTVKLEKINGRNRQVFTQRRSNNKLPSPEELEVELQEEQQNPDQPIDVQENEDGSVDINFDPSMVAKNKVKIILQILAELLTRRSTSSIRS